MSIFEVLVIVLADELTASTRSASTKRAKGVVDDRSSRFYRVTNGDVLEEGIISSFDYFIWSCTIRERAHEFFFKESFILLLVEIVELLVRHVFEL
jgi:hypothetical protein